MNRSIAVGAVATCVALGLSACTAPSPDVTVWTGTTSTLAEATCWAPTSAVSEAIASCISSAQSSDPTEIPTLAVTPGNTIGVNVDATVAETGWIVTAGGEALTASTLTQTYFRFTYPNVETPADGFLLAVTARGGDGDTDRGIWLFRLVPSGVV